MGATRPEALVRRRYWWPALSTMVREVKRSCEACDRVRAGPIGSHKPELRPLPLTSVGYRFSCDWCGGFPDGELGNKHLFVVVEHATPLSLLGDSAIRSARSCAY